MIKMKHLLILLAVFIGLAACVGESTGVTTEAPSDGVDVLYFHGRQRCLTCRAIEKEAKEVVDSLNNADVHFRVIDITAPENQALTDRYEITWSSLVLVRYDDGKETSENVTQFAFANARSNPAQFKKELAAKINQMLK